MSNSQITVSFTYANRSFSVNCTEDNKIREIIQQFIDKCNPKSKARDYNFIYEGNQIKPNTYDETIKANELLKGKKEFIIQAETNIKIINCPECNYGDCVVSLKDYRTVFYNCQHKHLLPSTYDNYFQDQIYYPEKIYCIDCLKNGKSDPLIFQCLTCSKIAGRVKSVCEECTKIKHIAKGHDVINYEDKNYICWKHNKKMVKYCFKCKKNFCDDCVAEHLKVEENKDHPIKSFDLLIPEEKEIKDLKKSLEEIQKNIEKLRIVVDDLIYTLNGSMRIYENYYKIANHIIDKYETFNKGKDDFKNFTIFKCLYNLKNSNKQITKDLKEIIDKKDKIEKSETLMKKYLDKKKNYYNPVKDSEDDPNNEDDTDWLEEVLQREKERNSGASNKSSK